MHACSEPMKNRNDFPERYCDPKKNEDKRDMDISVGSYSNCNPNICYQ